VNSAVLDVWEAVDREHPIAPLRWALLHAELIDPGPDRPTRRVYGAPSSPASWWTSPCFATTTWPCRKSAFGRSRRC
jgi:hypothetical protein